MQYWLVKSEPSTYSWQQLVKDGKATWDGVRNYAARLHLRDMEKGDQVFFYHSNEGLEIVGIAEVTKTAYQDPTTKDDWSVVDLKPVEALSKPVGLAEMKKEKSLENMALIRIGRLSVSPVSAAEFKHIMKMSGS